MRAQVLAAASVAAALVAAAPSWAQPAPAPLGLVVDAREAGQNILHVHLTVPIAHAGPLTLVYPKWIPGEHGPTGPIQNVAAVRMAANGNDLAWQRDLVDFYAFHVDVPDGVSSVDVSWDQLMTSDDPMSTPNLLIINWNRVVMYPQGAHSDDVRVKPSIILPDGWDFGTALPGPQRNGDRVDFAPVTLYTLVDSPLDAGRYAKHIMLLDDGTFTNQIDAFADEPRDLDLGSDTVTEYHNLVAEADALYGTRHWQHYHFLLTLTDAIPFNGIEHHESSDNRAAAAYWIDPDEFEHGVDLLSHEFSHSWNGKYRRPADLIVADYQAPEKTDLLWVYEGLNQYLGDLLAYRSGLGNPASYPEYLAYDYAHLDLEPGRVADPLIDTAVAAPYLYQAPKDWTTQRRTADDFYDEGELVWLSADAIIRTQSHGARSLDDFLKAFYGGRDMPPTVIPYTRQDVEDALGAAQPYDWHGFFQKWVYDVAVHPVSVGLDLSGWRLVWTSTPNHWDELSANVDGVDDFEYSMGFDVGGGGAVTHLLEGSPAARAGLAPDAQIVAVDGIKYSADVMRDALASARSSPTPIQLLVENGDRFNTIAVDYHGGLRYPHLQRVPNTADLLAQITSPHRRGAGR